jgi:hypothetical protein
MIKIERILNFIRDPLWQFIGVFVAVLIYFLSPGNSKDGAELSIYHTQKFKFEDYYLPTDKVKLTLIATKEEIDRATVDYFTIHNKSSKSISVADFISPLTVSPGLQTKRIFSISSCAIPTKSSQYLPNSGTALALNWTSIKNEWVAAPALLNSGDYSCVVIISEALPASLPIAKPIERFGWSGRILNVQIKNYDSTEDYIKNLDRKWMDQLATEVSLKGFSAYWFVVFQIFLFVFTVNVGLKGGWLASGTSISVAKLVCIVVLSTGSAEVLTDIFINLNIFNLHPIAYVFIFVHIFIVFYVIRLSKLGLKS